MGKWLLGIVSALCAAATWASGVPTLIPYTPAMTATGSAIINAGRDYVHAIDGSGLTTKDDGTIVHTTAHEGTMWMTSGNHKPTESAPIFYCVDLGKEYWLAAIKVWNFNMNGQVNRGVKATEVYVSSNAAAAHGSVDDICAWGDAVWTGELAIAANGNNYAGCDPITITPTRARYVGFVFTSDHGSDGYCGLSEVRFFEQLPEGSPDIAALSVVRTDGADSFTAEVTMGEAGGFVKALAYSSIDAEPIVTPMGEVAANTSGSAVLAGLDAATTYSIAIAAEGEILSVTNTAKEIICTGTPALAKVADGQEAGSIPAKVKVSRAAADPYPLEVSYTVASDNGESGVDYVAPSGAVTIPAGETSADVEIMPIVNASKNEDVKIVVSLAPGLYYTTGATAAEVLIANAVVPEDANYWIAEKSSDGLASNGRNWSKGMPSAIRPDSLVIRVSGLYATQDLTWDATTENGLATTVTSWTQDAEYTGTVTFMTTYPNVASPFKTFKVTGAMEIEGGKVTHPVSAVWDDIWDQKTLTLESLRESYVYRLDLEVGTLKLGEKAVVDASGKGHSWLRRTANVRVVCPSHGGRNERTTLGCYGNPKYPEDIGLASNLGSDSLDKCAVGGGAVKLKVNGACTIDGEINVDGAVSSGYLASGAAGSVLIEATCVMGSGLVHADGRFCGNTSQLNGTGGRIALLTTEPVDLAVLTVRAGGCSDGKFAAGGTVYLKDANMMDGVLYLNNPLNTAINAVPNRGVFVTNEKGIEWTFDGIRLYGNVSFYVSADTTLTLPNGFTSVTAPDNTSRCSGIYLDGGAIQVGEGDQTLATKWYFAPETEFVFPTNVSLENGACIGFSQYFDYKLNGYVEPSAANVKGIYCTVTGDMTVDATSCLSTEKAGPTQQSGQQVEGVWLGNHGGRRTKTGKTMDSVFDPVLPGIGQGNSYDYMKPGASMIVKVGGKLTLNGTANANPIDSTGGGYDLAAGGAINLTVGELEGAGSLEAKGFRNKQCGGRIAVKLTKKGATFENFTGSFQAQTVAGALASTSGSVYLETADEARNGGHGGTVYFDNLSTKLTATNSVPICANGYGADEVTAFKHAKLVVRGGAYAQVTVADANGTFRMRALEMSDPAKLDLFGHTLSVKSAKLGATRLAPGTYAATDEAVKDYLTDTAGGGTLLVSGGGLMMIIR